MGFVIVVVVAGLSALFYPAGWVSIVKRDRPELDENDPRVFATIRLIGTVFLIVALFVIWKHY